MGASSTPQLNWGTDNIEKDRPLAFINWEALKQFAREARRQVDDGNSLCTLSAEYNMGGLHIVRRIDFNDGRQWVACLQLEPPTRESCDRLRTELDTMAAVRSLSNIPIPQVFAHDCNIANSSGIGAAFMLMDFIPGNTAMDSFGGWDVHKGEMPFHFKLQLYSSLADIQTSLSSIRFSQIGTIVRRPNGVFDIGPIPNIGGPFFTAAAFFLT